MKKQILCFLLSIPFLCTAFAGCKQEELHTAHNFSVWKTLQAPTCSLEGIQSRSCDECGFIEYENIPMLNHTLVIDLAIPSTCESDGKTLGSHCGVCNAVLSPQETVTKKGHTHQNGKCSSCGNFDEEYCYPIYQTIRNEMATMNNKLNSIETIEDNLLSLPNDYKDVATIKNDLIFIKAQYEVFSNAVFRTLMKQLIADPTAEEYKEYYVDYGKVRQAYFNLIENQSNYPNWNIVNLANDYVYTVGSENVPFLLFVFVGLWEDDNGNYINVIESEDNSILFGSNLPNAMDNSQAYYFYVDGKVIGYSLQSNTENKFSAYRITEIGTNYIKVFCFYNSYTYTLKKA